MIEATTPTLTLTLPESVDLTLANELLVTFSQYETQITKTLDDNVSLIAKNIIGVTLSQEETLKFVPNRIVSVQVNWIVGDARLATTIGKIIVTPNLIPEVIET